MGRKEADIVTYRHSIRLLGPGARGKQVSGSLLRDLLEVLVEGARGAVRLQAKGRSSARGTQPAWLSAAADFEVLPLEAGSTVIPIEARPLAIAAPEQFAQGDFLKPIAKRSALGLFEESLHVAMTGDEESELFDQALLRKFGGFHRFLNGEISAVEIVTDELVPSVIDHRIRVEPAELEVIDRLIQKTPPPQRARLVGKLDMIRHHDRMFSLQLDTGETVKGIAETVAADALAAHWGDRVTVQGTATFRPSGSVLRIEADAIGEADEESPLWSRVPTPVFRGLEVRELHREQGPRSGLNAIYGKWPGDETDEEIAEALAEIS